ncbi:MAG: hypothetical protein E7224_04875 [Clostridiales bacterium]|nr:hypothetical protein [Clostridiales bacterium]
MSTLMFKKYFARFIFRLAVFCVVFYFYLFHADWFWDMIHTPVLGPVSAFHAIWAVFMGIMIIHIFPLKHLSMAERKSLQETYKENTGKYTKAELFDFVQQSNIRAWKVMLAWLSFNAIFGVLYLLDVIDQKDLFMLTVFFYLSDLICMLFFCPFQSFFMKNRCCVNCRIFDWGHFMMFTPMLFIRDFFTWSLFFTSLVVLIRWELIFAKYPERFWLGSNKSLRCENCTDKMCRIKKPLK